MYNKSVVIPSCSVLVVFEKKHCSAHLTCKTRHGSKGAQFSLRLKTEYLPISSTFKSTAQALNVLPNFLQTGFHSVSLGLWLLGIPLQSSSHCTSSSSAQNFNLWLLFTTLLPIESNTLKASVYSLISSFSFESYSVLLKIHD